MYPKDVPKVKQLKFSATSSSLEEEVGCCHATLLLPQGLEGEYRQVFKGPKGTYILLDMKGYCWMTICVAARPCHTKRK